MVRVAPIKMQVGPKVLWFDPNDIDVHAGDKVIVSTERGVEFATATADVMEVSDELIAQLKSPLKPVLRLASEEDIARAQELSKQSDEALAVFKEFAAQTNEEMRPILVEFLFDGDKAVFYFEAEDRIDFRELVRKLAAHFHIRVDMRQIGVRDGARIIGGLGHCGQELCCKRLGGEFSPVSIRMAKEQNLSLNPQKISGVCGRLMCCLRYEYETYKEVNARSPKLNSKVKVEGMGEAKVTEINVPCERITLQLEDGHSVKIPLSEMEVSGEGKRPNLVRAATVEQYSSANKYSISESLTTLEVTTFTAEEKLADAATYENSKKRNEEKEQARSGRRRRRRRTNNSASHARNAQTPLAKEEKNASSANKKSASENKRQNSGKKSSAKNSTQSNNRNKAANNASRKDEKRPSGTARRPGQKSSGLRGAQNQTGKKPQAQKQSRHTGERVEQTSHATPYKKSRRRRHTAGGESHENG